MPNVAVATMRRLVAAMRERRPHPTGPVPSRAVLVEYAERQAAGVGLVAGAAVLTYAGGFTEQVWPYGLMAAALVAQVLAAAVALGDEERRRRLRVSVRPAWFLGSVAVVLAVSGLVGWFGGEPAYTSVTATVAAAGLALSAAPASLVFAPRR